MNSSGMFYYGSQLALALSKKAKVTYITSGHNAVDIIRKQRDPKMHDMEIITIDAPHSPVAFALQSLNPLMQLKMVSLIKKRKPDALIAYDTYFWNKLWVSLLPRVPVIFTQHDPEPHSGERNAWIIRRYLAGMRKRADHIIVHGAGLKDMLVRQGVPAGNISVTALGNQNFFTLWKKGIPEEPQTLLFYGRIVDYKGLDTLIQATESLLNKHHRLKLIIAGAGDLSAYVPLMKHKENYEIINRFITEAQTAPLFERASIVVLPYKDATQSGVVPIAMAFKKAVVATKVGALAEVIDDGKTGLLVKPDDVQALALAMERLLEDKELRNRLASAGKQSIEKSLDTDRIADAYLEVIGRINGTSRSATSTRRPRSLSRPSRR